MKVLAVIFSFFWTQVSFAQNNFTYFNTYEENKKAFIEKAGSHITQAWPLKNDPHLTTDLAKYSYNSDQLLVITSGLHGIEGYVGSALQRWIIDQIENKKWLKQDILLIHSLNPWGMKNKRRTDENNIDLNRNFSVENGLYTQKNEDYAKINSFLNPESKLNVGFFHNFQFILNSIQLILKYSMETLRHAVLSGQYAEPQGLYYGGNQRTELQNHIDELIDHNLKPYKKITWINLHTGYGERAKLHLLANSPDDESSKTLSQLFPKNKIDFGSDKSFYKTRGDLETYLNAKSTPQQKIQAIVFEYGTLDSQKTLGSIESLRRMVMENQGFQHGYESRDDKIKSDQLFQDMFFPQEEDWKVSVLKQTQDIFLPFFK